MWVFIPDKFRIKSNGHIKNNEIMKRIKYNDLPADPIVAGS